jgi:hypothetical protein
MDQVFFFFVIRRFLKNQRYVSFITNPQGSMQIVQFFSFFMGNRPASYGPYVGFNLRHELYGTGDEPIPKTFPAH